jgi:hypothetical protein
MGTSADRTAGRGGDWTPLKRAASSYVRSLNSGGGIGHANANRVLARHVPVLGGVAGAAASARAGRSGVQRLGSLLSGIGSTGLQGTLNELGLVSLVGKDRFDVLDALVTYVAGTGDDLDSQAARDAVCDVLDEVFEGAEDWSQLDDSSVNRSDLVALLELFLAQYVYNKVPVIAERLSKQVGSEALQRADAEMRAIIKALVHLRIPEDPFKIDWGGPQGREIADDAIRLTYEAIQGLEDESS